MKLSRYVISFSIVIVCIATPSFAESEDWPKEFELEKYFIGKTTAWGIFENRQGELVRQFKVSIVGEMQDNELVLTEDFHYANGEQQTRIWRIERLENGGYQGRAADVVGNAVGEVKGNQLYWAYHLELPVGDKSYEVKFTDKMYLQPNDVLINRAIVTKWGFRVGEVTIVFLPDS